MTTSLGSRTTLLARFPANLNLPEGQLELVDNAAEAVRREYRSSVRWKRLRCLHVARLVGRPTDTLFVLEVGHSIQFDWTWEGAVAFRPEEPGKFNGDIDATDDFTGSTTGDSPASGRHGVWSGEVVEVDEAGGRLFVSVSEPERPPCRGTFFVRPFEFLAFLHSLFCQPGNGDLRRPLASRLNASRGDIHPAVVGGPSAGLEDLKEMWRSSWGVLWGPPGCGKTYTLGRQVAACLGHAERILVVSTTNKATDAAALAIGRAALAASPGSVAEGRILRIGKGADHDAYEPHGLLGLLRGTETELLRQIAALTRDLERADRHEDRAVLRSRIQDLRRTMKDRAFNIFVSPDVMVVVATAFKAVTLLSDPAIRAMAAAGEAPFTTVIIDEAGLMPRAVVAGMSLLAARRVVVVGDAKQLAPISKISRVLPTFQKVWLDSSCLTHLQRVEHVRAGVHMLREQHRMHPQVSRVVSHYQYDCALQDAPSVLNRQTVLPPLLAQHPRAVWYVLDEDSHKDLPAIRAERGPGNASWVRPVARKVLEKLFSDPEVRNAGGLFITPFKAQSRDIAAFFAEKEKGRDGWSAGTVHARQGTEADVVVFDTVNAGSCGWSYDEWKRLVNVGLSRAREFVLLLASRAEMDEPYLRPLLESLAPRVLSRSGKAMVWKEVSARATFIVPVAVAGNPDLVGNQLARRKSLRPVMSAEQQRLCGHNMDGKPRLVRGVAGSGKTYVLAHWLQKTVHQLLDRPTARVWAVFANKSLQRLIADTIEEAWKAEGSSGPFPWERVELCHIKDVLSSMLPNVGLSVSPNDFDYDALAARYLEREPFRQIKPCCQAMFIDEAQDMGPSTLKLLSGLVEQTDPDDPKSRAVNIFYDNAQNIYGRKKPELSEIGLNMQGRSTVMKESFRSTRPITEFALNVLYRLQPPGNDPDHKELVDRGLIEASNHEGATWWNVRFCQVEGPTPLFRKYRRLQDQVDAIGDQVVRWIRDEGVKPCDISILCNDNAFKERVEETVGPRLHQINARLVSDPAQGWARDENAVVASTSHSFKGYEAEIVVVGGLERFIAQRRIVPNNLYVAMTRARSVLAIYAYDKKNPAPEAARLLATVQECLNAQLDRPKVEREISNLDDFEEVLQRIGPDKRDWLARLWKSYLIQQEPITAEDGEILAEPLFWFQADDRVVACFGDEEPGAYTLHKLEDNRIEVIQPSQELPGQPKA